MSLAKRIDQQDKTVKITDEMRLDELSNTICICFAMLTEYDFKEIANLTGLCLSTIQRLYNGQYSLMIRWNTVDCLATAAGIRISRTKTGLKLRLVRS